MTRLLKQSEIESFKKILSGYKPNEQALARFQKANVGVIAGPVAAGKDTLRTLLVERPGSKYLPILSTTTRPPRKNEIEERAYHFSSIEKVAEKLSNGECLQGALIHNQQVSILDAAEINKLHDDQIGLSILIVQTEKLLFALKPSLKALFLSPPNLKVMIERIHGDRTLAEDEINRRLSAAKQELEIALQTERYYCLISDDKDRVSELGHKYFAENYRDDNSDRQARRGMANLLSELKTFQP